MWLLLLHTPSCFDRIHDVLSCQKLLEPDPDGKQLLPQ